MIFRKATLLLFLLSFFVAGATLQAQPTITTMTLQGLTPTNDTELTWQVTFSEPVTGVTTSNFTLAPNGVTATIDNVYPGLGNLSWFVEATGVFGNGTLGADLSNPAGITGASGALTDTITGSIYEVDNTSPQVVSITRLDPSPTGASTVNFAITFSEPVTGVSTINFAPGGTLTGTVDNIATTDGLTWTASISGIVGSGTIKLDLTDTSGITDIAGNSLFSDYTAGEAYQIDQSGPTIVCITRLDANPTSATSVQFLVEFDSQTSNVQTSSFSVTGTGTTSGTVSSVTSGGDGTTWTVTVTSIEGQGTLTIALTDPAGIVDVFGNPMTVTGTSCQESYNVDRVGPEVISIDLPGDNPTSATIVEFLVTFSEPVTSGTLSDFSLIVTGTTTGTITNLTTLGSLTTVTVTGVSGSGSMCLRVNAPSTITDILGNPLTNIPVQSGCYVICQSLAQVINSIPSNGQTVDTSTSLISWTPPAPDLSYHVYFDGALIDSTTDTQTSMPQPLAPGEHRYMIDVEGSCTSGTEVIFYVLDRPILVFPSPNFQSCIAPTVFSWEPVNGATTYTLYIDSVAVTSTTETSAEVPGIGPGPHTWYIIAESESTTRQSETRNFTVLVNDPNPPVLYETNGTIYDIEVVGATTYIAGDFTLVRSNDQWVARNNIARYNTGTSVLQDWAPNVNGSVYTLHATTSSLLLGGNFTRINNEQIARIAGIDYTTTTANQFRPGANAPVRAIETIGNTVYYGGDFTEVGAQVYNFATPSVPATRLAIADLATSAAPVSAGLNPNASVRDLLYDGSHLYVAGVFSAIGGQPLRGLARLDVTAPAAPTIDTTFVASPDQLPVDLYVYTMHKVGNTLYIGGSFNEVLGEDRPNAAALLVGDLNTSTTVLPWDPRPNSAVYSIDSRPGGMVYLGGTFTTLNNARSTYLVAVDPVFGNQMTCSFNGDRLIYAVEALPAGADRVAAGGQATVTGRNVTAP